MMNKYKIIGERTILYALKSGKIVKVIIDSVDLDKLIKFNYSWGVTSTNAVKVISTYQGKRKYYTLSRFLLGYSGKLVVDHIDGNKLDNRRKNLRLCTFSQNNYSLHKTRKGWGKVGVGWYPNTKKWTAYMRINGKLKMFGYYKTEKEAIDVRKSAERKYLGEFAPQC